MKQYLKMADVFKKEVLVEKSTAYTLKNELDKFYRAREVNDDTLMCSGDDVASYAAHAINSHDELVQMNQELLEALEVIAASEEFQGDSFVCDFQTLQGVARDSIEKAKAAS